MEHPNGDFDRVCNMPLCDYLHDSLNTFIPAGNSLDIEAVVDILILLVSASPLIIANLLVDANHIR